MKVTNKYMVVLLINEKMSFLYYLAETIKLITFYLINKFIIYLINLNKLSDFIIKRVSFKF